MGAKRPGGVGGGGEMTRGETSRGGNGFGAKRPGTSLYDLVVGGTLSPNSLALHLDI